MSIDTRMKAFATVWIVAVLLVGFLAEIGSLAGWFAATVFAFGPALTLLHFSRQPLATTSQRIQDARR